MEFDDGIDISDNTLNIQWMIIDNFQYAANLFNHCAFIECLLFARKHSRHLG